MKRITLIIQGSNANGTGKIHLQHIEDREGFFFISSPIILPVIILNSGPVSAVNPYSFCSDFFLSVTEPIKLKTF